MAAEAGADVHHRTPRYLLGHFDAAAEGFADWSELGAEAERLSMEVRVLSREGLRALVESSTREIPTTEHRTLHQEASDFVRWGRRGGRSPVGWRALRRLYSSPVLPDGDRGRAVFGCPQEEHTEKSWLSVEHRQGPFGPETPVLLQALRVQSRLPDAQDHRCSSFA